MLITSELQQESAAGLVKRDRTTDKRVRPGAALAAAKFVTVLFAYICITAGLQLMSHTVCRSMQSVSVCGF